MTRNGLNKGKGNKKDNLGFHKINFYFYTLTYDQIYLDMDKFNYDDDINLNDKEC
jgi:hypothetical protein